MLFPFTVPPTYLPPEYITNRAKCLQVQYLQRPCCQPMKFIRKGGKVQAVPMTIKEVEKLIKDLKGKTENSKIEY